MHTISPAGRRLGVAGAITGIGLALALVIPSGANAASVVSQGDGRLIDTTLLTTDALDSVASLGGAKAVNTDGSDAVTSDTPLDPTALSALSIPINGVNLFGDNGIIQLGGVGQYAQANGDGSSVAFSGAVSQASSLAGIGTDVTPSNIGSPAPGSNAEITVGDPATDPASLDVQWGLLAASAKQTADGTQSGSYTLEAKQIQVGGTVLTGALAPIDTALKTVLGVAGTLGVNVADPIAGGTVTITMDDLLAAAGVSSINDLPAGTDLVQYVPIAVAAKVTQVVNDTLSTLSTDASNLGLVGLPLSTALTTAKATITPLLSGMTTSLVAPLSTALTAAVQLRVNEQTHAADGSFTETALQVGLGPNGSLGQVNLANATVGPNGGLEAVPVINAASAGIAGGALAVGLAIAAAVMAARRRNAAAPAAAN
ncbi:choice-of-anchor G family protein [Gryllotalpicola koreensis]|uniref:Choice-of-anchor G family protein n=1 Tax=Gryllotalpicola koreensis TaxID=993086 RepID=A0ABP8A008_9MICO